MVGVHGREGDRWIAMSDCVLSDKHSSPKGLRSAIVGETPVFADALKNALEKEGFKHGVFHRLKWDDEAKAPLTLWELDSDITMPPCLTPIVNRDDRYTFEGADGSENPFLDYPAAEVEKFGEFDIAVIRERFPYNDRNDLTDRHLIVSQKFRRFCKKHKVPVSYGLVRFL